MAQLSKGSLIVAIVTGAAVISLLFLPEIVKLGTNLLQGGGSATTAQRGLTGEEEDLLGAEERERVAQLEARSTEARPGETRVNLEDKPQRKITWEHLRAREIALELNGARQVAIEIEQRLERSQRDVIFALQNFADGIQRVQNPDSERWMSPNEAIRYLESLDVAVTDAMLRTGTPRPLYQRWSEVALSRALGDDRSHLYKLNRDVAFNPEMVLLELELLQNGKDGKPDPKQRSNIKAKFRVRAADVERVVLYRNGNFAEELRLGAPDKRTGLSTFFFQKQYSVDGTYTVEVRSKYKEIYRRTYAFYPRARGLVWEEGVYRLPFAPGDPALDRYFALGSGAPSADSPYSVRFGAPSGTTF